MIRTHGARPKQCAKIKTGNTGCISDAKFVGRSLLSIILSSDFIFPRSAVAVPAVLLPIAVIRLHGRKMPVSKSHQIKPLFSPTVASTLVRAFPYPTRQTVCLFANAPQDPVRYLIGLQRLYADAQLINFTYSPQFQTVSHILHGAFHSSAGGGGYRDRLFSAHLRQRSVNHPPRAEMIQKTHHLACGMVHIHRAFQYQNIRIRNCRHKRFQFFIMRAV